MDNRQEKELVGMIMRKEEPLLRKLREVERFLDDHRDGATFISNLLAGLVSRLFGMDQEGPSWLSAVVRAPEDFDKLMQMFGPQGKVQKAMRGDGSANLRFTLTTAVLPALTKMLLAHELGVQQLNTWPQYRGSISAEDGQARVVVQPQMWFLALLAFSATKEAPAAAGRTLERTQTTTMLRTMSSVKQSVGTVVGGAKPKGVGQAAANPYLHLLQQYMEALLPRGSGPAQYEAAVMLNILVEYWLTDGDEPVPRATSDLRPASAAVYRPPSAGTLAALQACRSGPANLQQALQALTRHLTVVEKRDQHGRKQPQWALDTKARSGWLPLIAVQVPEVGPKAYRGLGSHAPLPPQRLAQGATPPWQAVSKRFYRYMKRGFQGWPESTNIGAFVNLYLMYAAPWWAPPLGPTEPATASPLQRQGMMSSKASQLLHTVVPGDRQGTRAGAAVKDRPAEYDPGVWLNYVLCNLPFYSLLLPALLNMLLARAKFSAKEALTELIKVLTMLKAAPQLNNVLRAVESDLMELREGQQPTSSGYMDVLPWLLNQAQEFEAAANASAAKRAMQASPELPRFVAFSADPGSAAATIQAILKWTAGANRDLHQQAQELALDVFPMSQLASAAPAQQASDAGPAPNLNRGISKHAQLKGDRMFAPVQPNESRLLAVSLVKLSMWLNSLLGLDRPVGAKETSGQGMVKDIMLWLRKKGFRINLRHLAEYQTLVFLAITLFLLLYVVPFLFMIIGGLWRFLAEPLDEPGYGSSSGHQQNQDDWHPHHGQHRYSQQQRAQHHRAQQQKEQAFLKAQQSHQVPAPTGSQQGSAGSQTSEQTYQDALEGPASEQAHRGSAGSQTSEQTAAETGVDADSEATKPRRRPSHQQSWDQAIASAAASLDRASRQQQEQSATSQGRP